MCNYGHAAEVEPEQMVSYVQQALDTIDQDLSELYVSPSGSLLDEREVPIQARRLLLELIRDYPVDRFSFETRAETVTKEAVADLVEHLPGKDIAVGFGLESADPKVLRFCLNKPGQPVEFTHAAELLHDSGIQVYANIALGAPFLSPREAIADTVSAVMWSLDHGADLAIIFPMHVKSHTLLHWLHMHDRYEPPSLWALVEVLESLDPGLLPNVTISWYRSDYGDEQSITASPSTCQTCVSDVLKALDAFRAEASADAVRNLSLLECECRTTWRVSISEATNEPLLARIAENYEAIAVGLGLGAWWDKHSGAVLNELDFP